MTGWIVNLNLILNVWYEDNILLQIPLFSQNLFRTHLHKIYK